MATKRMDIPDAVHSQIAEYAADYGCRSMGEALTEMVAMAMQASADERLDLRKRKQDRQARLAGIASTAARRPAARPRRAAQKPADGPEGGQEAPAQPETAQDAPEAPVEAQNGHYAHAGQ